MTRGNNKNILLVAFLLCLIILTQNSYAEDAAVDSVTILENTIATNESALADQINANLSLSESLDLINASIYQQKQDLQKSTNPFRKYSLNRSLREAQRIATDLEAGESRVRSSNNLLQNNYKKIIGYYESSMQKILSQPSAEALARVKDLEQNIEKYKRKLAIQSFKNARQSEIVIEPDDDIERLQMKTALLQDIITRLEQKEQQIIKRLEEQETNLNVYKDMIIFTDNLQQSIDPEQEYFDQERYDQLKEEIQLLETRILQDKDLLMQNQQEVATTREKQTLFEDAIEKLEIQHKRTDR